jgi:hypothetical protein
VGKLDTMIFSARTLLGTGAAAAGAPPGAGLVAVARRGAAWRVAAWATVWPVMAALAALAARRGRRVVCFFFSEIICGKGQTPPSLS